MNARSKLAWADIPRQSLRRGLACGDGGVRVMLLMGEDRRPTGPASGTAMYPEPQPETCTAEKPR
jgi:hypothetical protein